MTRHDLQAAESHLIDAANLVDCAADPTEEPRAIADTSRAIHAALGQLTTLLDLPARDGAYEISSSRQRRLTNDFGAFDAFCRESTEVMNRLVREHRAKVSAAPREIANIERRQKEI